MAYPKPIQMTKFERAAWREWLIIIAPLSSGRGIYHTSRFIQPARRYDMFSAGAEGGAIVTRVVRIFSTATVSRWTSGVLRAP
jgi:hypothetical protein